MFTDLETAELIKYAANAFLATKITFINEIADLCEAVGADVQDVARGIGLDGRIGAKFLHAGPGYGGSCFPKDTLALVEHRARRPTRRCSLVEATVEVNEARKRAMAARSSPRWAASVAGKTVALLGLTFKPNTDDMREAPSLAIVPGLQAGAKVQAHDPEGMAEATQADAGPRLLRRPLRGDDRRRRAGADHRVEPVSRARPRAREARAEAAGRGRSAQHLSPAEMRAAGFHYSSIGRR